MSFVTRYQAYASQCTSAPPIYHQVLAYGLLAAVARRHVWMDYAGDRLHPNLWICLLGDSGALHKSTSINLAVRVLRGMGEDLLYPSDFSLQRLYDIMKARPQGVLVYREFRSLADMLSRDYMAGCKSTLTDLYDCPPMLEYDTKGTGLVRVQDPCLTILAASTGVWFAGKEAQKDLAGGFLSRMVYVPAILSECGEEEALPPGPEATSGLRDTLAAELTNVGHARGRMTLERAAAAAYREWFAHHRKHSRLLEGRYTPFLTRMEALALKLAMLDHLAEGHDAVEPVRHIAIVEACELVHDLERRLVATLEEDVAFTPHEQDRLQVLKIIPNSGESMSQRDLSRKLRLPAKVLESILGTLVFEERITRFVVKPTGGGRPSVQYRRI